LQASLIVKDLMMLGQFLRFPQDDHALACVLKSPLVPEPIDDDALFNLAYDQSAASLWSRLPAGSENQMMLSQLMTATATPFELFAGVLRKSRQAMLTRLGQEAEDAATEFLNLALEYEQTDSPSLIGFLDWMAAGDTTIRREMEQGGGAVRIMTVHGAKGLQAPIVFLADSYDPPQADRDKLLRVTSEGPTRGLMIYESDTIMALPIVAALKQAEADERDAERMRLLYVGMTRAADELYICGSLNKSVISANADKLWYEHVQRAFQSDGLQNIRRVDGALRYGSEPEFIGRQSTTIKETTAADWAVPLPKSAPLQSLSIGKRSDNFDHAAIARGLATHRLVEMMADIDEDARLQHGLRWAKRLNLEDDLVQRLHDSLTSADLAPLFGADGQSEVTIEAKGQRSGRIDRLAITPQAIYLLDYKTNRFPPETIAASHDYAKQMAGYAQLLSKAYPGLPIRAALLWTQTGKIHWISPDILSQSLEQETA